MECQQGFQRCSDDIGAQPNGPLREVHFDVPAARSRVGFGWSCSAFGSSQLGYVVRLTPIYKPWKAHLEGE